MSDELTRKEEDAAHHLGKPRQWGLTPSVHGVPIVVMEDLPPNSWMLVDKRTLSAAVKDFYFDEYGCLRQKKSPASQVARVNDHLATGKATQGEDL